MIDTGYAALPSKSTRLRHNPQAISLKRVKRAITLMPNPERKKTASSLSPPLGKPRPDVMRSTTKDTILALSHRARKGKSPP
ncbi:MAG: hypothetical protein KTR25_20575 [Myxococcales bacterium]|nr:hypothetical protein [Myxococcales bacterium]